MFDKTLNFRLVSKQRGEMGATIHLFVFRTPKRRCIIFEAHIYEACTLAVVKFYDKAHRLSNNRFSLMNRSNEAAITIRTSLQIMLHLHSLNPYLSFAFMGAPDDDQSKVQTRRFRIYQSILYRLFSDVDFQHITNPAQSLYLLANRLTGRESLGSIFAVLKQVYPEMKD